MAKRASTCFNFVADHLTMIVEPGMYKPMYAFLRIILGVPREGLIYEKRKRWPGTPRDASMTFAVSVGDVAKEKSIKLARTMLAIVQPTEPAAQTSHVRDMLSSHKAAAHWQHVALRTPDLVGFHKHAIAHGVNFITPLMEDKDEDLIQVFSGELFAAGMPPSGLFFEFVQRDVSPQLLTRIRKADRQAFFRDRTFLGLYGEKEREYQSGQITPIWDHELVARLMESWKKKEIWELSQGDLDDAARLMREYASSKTKMAVV
ncbi:MAG: hypothetical protein HY078_15550 [Elusimicrobia bacterium]|nr:hypothetical protein [Elusimicrobiota bacterium]